MQSDSKKELKRVLVSKGSAYTKYLQRIVGEESLWALVKFELIMAFFGNLPGILGLKLRSIFYNYLIGEKGKNTVLLPHVTLRCPNKIKLGKNVLIDEYVSLDVKGSDSEGIILGDNTVLEKSALLSTGYGGYIKIGKNCGLGPAIQIHGHGGVEIGNNCLIAGQTYIVAASHVFEDPSLPIDSQGFIPQKIVIKDDVWIGAGVKVLGGVTIKRGAVIGAGAVVNKDIEEFEVAAGVPVRVIKIRGKKKAVSKLALN